MPQDAKKLVRRVLKGPLLRGLETEYRLARASYANARFNWPARGMRVIMITGTNGKTTSASYVFSILRAAGYSVALLSTAEVKINNQSQLNDTNLTAIEPVPLRRKLAEFKAHQVDFVILEATSIALDQYRLFGIPCEVAVLTNLTQDHLDYHKTMDNYAAAKSRLWKLKPKFSVLNHDDEWFEYFKKRATGKLLTYGKKNADVTLSNYKSVKNGGQFTLHLKDGKSIVNIALAGEYNAYNATAAATVAEVLGVDSEVIEQGIENLTQIPGRLERVPTKTPYAVIVDYAHTPDGLEKLLTAVREMTKGKVWLVFGSCGDRDKLKRPLMGSIAAKLADKLVLTDEESYSEDPQAIIDAIRDGITKVKKGKEKTTEILDRKQAIKFALTNAQKGDTVLITGLGHEQFRIENGQKLPWSDTEVVKGLLKKL